ncbi:MAG: hypothetical protein JWR21_167 [Herminiimonas sp.]|nr:hypothetical protein [Herminiimonas sp.]
MFQRDTPWRQGSPLQRQEAVALGLIPEGDIKSIAVMVSHDCDITNGHEDDVEIIVGPIVARDGSFVRARNPRRLHLQFTSASTSSQCVDLLASEKRRISKAAFRNDSSPDSALSLSPEERLGLKQWLAARYGRPAFPDAFEDRLAAIRLEKAIAKIVGRASNHVVGIFFDLGPDRFAELPETDPYVLRIMIAYDATDGGSAARQEAEDVARLITEAYTKESSPETSNGVILDGCNAVADTYLTLFDLRRLDQWRVDYISFRQNPPGRFVDPTAI